MSHAELSCNILGRPACLYAKMSGNFSGSRGGSGNFGWWRFDIICNTCNLSATPFLQISLPAGQSLGGGGKPLTPPGSASGQATLLGLITINLHNYYVLKHITRSVGVNGARYTVQMVGYPLNGGADCEQGGVPQI